MVELIHHAVYVKSAKDEFARKNLLKILERSSFRCRRTYVLNNSDLMETTNFIFFLPNINNHQKKNKDKVVHKDFSKVVTR